MDDIRFEYMLAEERRRKGLPMLWEDQKQKDMELYPLIEPFVNYTRDRVHNFSNGSVKVAKDLHYFVKSGGKKRVLVAEPQPNDPANT